MNYPFPQFGYVRLTQILGDPSATPPIPAVIPVSKSTWWAGVKSGRFPAPMKLGPRVTVWLATDIIRLVESTSQVKG